MPLVATRGAASAQGFGEFARVTPPIYIEDVFSTYLYTGTAAAQTITNNIDVSGKGGLVWIKSRTLAQTNMLYTQALGVEALCSSNTNGLGGFAASENLSSFNSNGFSLLSTASRANTNAEPYASWTFREQAKFFDVVTYTGNSTARTISHNLGSVPGCIIVKATSAAGYQWPVYHRSLVAGNIVWLNLTDASTASSGVFTTTAPTSTVFSLGAGSGANDNGVTYVAYLFAHDAGGFGATGTDNVISCGSFTADGSGNATVNLGYEPQWLLIKSSSNIENWVVLDNMRGISYAAAGDAVLYPNLSNAEVADNKVDLTSTGFYANTFGATRTYIYIAIRRGPMKTPTSATNIYQPIYDVSSLANKINGTVGPIDLTIQGQPTGALPSYWMTTFDRLRGSNYLVTAGTNAETAGSVTFDTNVGVRNAGWFATGGIAYNFGRAPGFFDVVCYTGTGSATTQAHNLTVVPELMIIKKRNSATNGGWLVGFYVSASTGIDGVGLNDTAALSTRAWSSGNFNSAPTASVFGVGSFGVINALADTYVAYLFASCPGVSKVGSYTGTGALQTINCGFAAGARFVLIKRTDSTGDWWVYDSARGITSGNDPYLFLNSTAAEVTNTNYVDTASTGFQVTAAAPAGLNANGGTYIFLAIA